MATDAHRCWRSLPAEMSSRVARREALFRGSDACRTCCPRFFCCALAYLGLFFAVAYFGDRHQRAWSASPTIAPTVYGLSLAIYCTSWTFYGAQSARCARRRASTSS